MFLMSFNAPHILDCCVPFTFLYGADNNQFKMVSLKKGLAIDSLDGVRLCNSWYAAFSVGGGVAGSRGRLATDGSIARRLRICVPFGAAASLLPRRVGAAVLRLRRHLAMGHEAAGRVLQARSWLHS